MDTKCINCGMKTDSVINIWIGHDAYPFCWNCVRDLIDKEVFISPNIQINF